MSIPSPLQQYHFHVILIWWHSPFKMFYLWQTTRIYVSGLLEFMYPGHQSTYTVSRLPEYIYPDYQSTCIQTNYSKYINHTTWVHLSRLPEHMYLAYLRTCIKLNSCIKITWVHVSKRPEFIHSDYLSTYLRTTVYELMYPDYLSMYTYTDPGIHVSRLARYTCSNSSSLSHEWSGVGMQGIEPPHWFRHARPGPFLRPTCRHSAWNDKPTRMLKVHLANRSNVRTRLYNGGETNIYCGY